MGETKTESAHPHSWAFAKPDSSVMKAPPAEAQARRPEFSQCFGDKAAPEELTEGESVSTSTDSRSPLPCSHMLEDMSAARHPGARPALRSGVDGVRGWRVVGAADLLTTVEFDESGDYLATGDRGGRVVIFEKGDDIKQVRASCEERGGRWREGGQPAIRSDHMADRYPRRGGQPEGRGGSAHGDAPPLLMIQVLPCGRLKHACKYKFYNEVRVRLSPRAGGHRGLLLGPAIADTPNIVRCCCSCSSRAMRASSTT